MEQIFEIIKWWSVLEFIGILALPISASLFKNFADMGISVSKIVGILLFTYFSWAIVTFGFSYGNPVLLVSIIFIGALSFLIIRKNKININATKFLLNESIFSASFIVFLIIRSYSPGNYFVVGEKFMDTTFINAVLRSTDFPLYDPWFAGASANYYYFSYIIIGNLIKLTNSTVSVGFNIASAAFYAISLTCAFGIGYNLILKIKGGLIAALFVTIIGNLVGLIQLIVIIFLPSYYKLYYVQGADIVSRLSQFSLWPSEIIIAGTYVQFPFFSFLIGDLHPNFIAIPFQLLFITILISILKAKKASMLHLIVLGLSLGFFIPLNTWNYPVYMFLSALVLFLQKEKFYKRLFSFVSVAIISFTAYAPFYASIKIPQSISIMRGNRTEIIDYVLIFGLFLFLFACFLAKGSFKLFNRNIASKEFLFVAIFATAAFIFKFQLLLLLLPLTLSFVFLIKENDDAMQTVFILIIAGILFSLFGEVFYIEDTLKSSVYFRSNTIYKLYDQIWILYAVAGSYIFYHFLQSNRRLAFLSCGLVIISLIFPIAATYSKSLELKYSPTLDGELTLKKSYPYEYEAIEWFRKVNGTPVVLEAAGYTGAWNSYISAFTGLPTVLGWEWHEYQWRMNLEEINIRRSEVERAYTSSNYGEIENIINKYNVKYIYIGPVERDRYKVTNVFEQNKNDFKLVFKNKGVEIYEVLS